LAHWKLLNSDDGATWVGAFDETALVLLLNVKCDQSKPAADVASDPLVAEASSPPRIGAELKEAMTDTRVIRPIRVAAQRIEATIAIGRGILIRGRACRSMFARRISDGPRSRTVEVRRRSVSSIVR